MHVLVPSLSDMARWVSLEVDVILRTTHPVLWKASMTIADPREE